MGPWLPLFSRLSVDGGVVHSRAYLLAEGSSLRFDGAKMSALLNVVILDPPRRGAGGPN